jgi:hypothetical protein
MCRILTLCAGAVKIESAVMLRRFTPGRERLDIACGLEIALPDVVGFRHDICFGASYRQPSMLKHAPKIPLFLELV